MAGISRIRTANPRRILNSTPRVCFAACLQFSDVLKSDVMVTPRSLAESTTGITSVLQRKEEVRWVKFFFTVISISHEMSLLYVAQTFVAIFSLQIDCFREVST